MAEKIIKEFLKRFTHKENLPARDLVLLKLLREFTELTPEQQKQVEPRLMLTLKRHDKFADLRIKIHEFFEKNEGYIGVISRDHPQDVCWS